MVRRLITSFVLLLRSADDIMVIGGRNDDPYNLMSLVT
jgi:hypothetical protein